MALPIVLTTLNATYQHSAFGLRYLHANLGAWQKKAEIVEFTIAQNARDIAETLLAKNPRIIGFGVYIWNTRETEAVIRILKVARPDIVVVLGGPEVSYESEGQPICQLSDYVVRGEAENLFRELCEGILEKETWPPTKFLSGPLPNLETLALPYQLYTGEDIRHRVIYVEASRGCPYKCEFCLSSLDTAVRNFPLKRLLHHFSELIERGARQFKFVDRTFNLSPAISTAILSFFLEHQEKGLFLHFELVPDRLPPELKDLIKKFPPNSLQFEIGIQTWDPKVSELISRRQNWEKTRENLRFLRQETHVHLHTDLIVGLPGETWESFGRGFDELAKLAPHEIQVGVLKRLKGTPIIRHDTEWGMQYETEPPFTVIQTRTLPFTMLQQLVRFAKFWDLYANRGQFPRFMQSLRELAAATSFFQIFASFSQFLHERHPQRHSIALQNLAESAYRFLIEKAHFEEESAREIILQDYCEGPVKRDIPLFLRDNPEPLVPSRPRTLLTRQHHHSH